MPPSSLWLSVLLVAGLYLLVKGADHLIDGAAALALRAGVSPFSIGLTVVAFGTSAPELATSVSAVLHASPSRPGPAQLALGNVIGSNTCNLALILGCAAWLARVEVGSARVRRELPLLALLSVFLAAFVLRGQLGHVEGMVLLGAFVTFFVLAAGTKLVQRRWTDDGGGPRPGDDAESGEDVDVDRLGHLSLPAAAGLVTLGLLLLGVGAELLVDSAETLAMKVGISEEFIGLTVVAFGTSLPELATTFTAARKGSLDLAFGNVIGSNIFNIGLVVGLPSLVLGWPVRPDGLVVDLVVMLLLTCVVIGIAVVRRRFDRREGLGLMGAYVLYVAYLVASAALGS